MLLMPVVVARSALYRFAINENNRNNQTVVKIYAYFPCNCILDLL